MKSNYHHSFKMISSIIFWIALSSFFLEGNAQKCPDSVQGATWDYTENDIYYERINSVEACKDLCINGNFSCQGYSWVPDRHLSGFMNNCYLFSELNNMHECEACSSGTAPEYLEEGKACSTENPDDIISQEFKESAQACLESCNEKQGCNAFTWFNETSPIFHNLCFTYPSCDNSTIQDCPTCVSAKLNCVQNKQCYEYNILSEESRNVYMKGSEDQYFVDLASENAYTHTSTNWNGPGVYRIMEPAGNAIPESPQEENYCTSLNPVWMNSSHPTEKYSEKDVSFCPQSGACVDGTSTLCDCFFVYSLPEMTGNSRYCADKLQID